MKSTTPATLKWLIASSVLYMALALIAAVVAIRANIPASPGGSGSGLPLVEDFLVGKGTAMSPPLYWLIAQAILTVLATKDGRRGTVGAVGLAIFGLLSGIGALMEPIVGQIFSPATFDPLKTVLEAGIIVLPFVMMVLGMREWSRRRRERGCKPSAGSEQILQS
jgi:hypothetical protein